MGLFSFTKVDDLNNIHYGDKVCLLHPLKSKMNVIGFYDGYGRINGRDVYFLLAMWNRKYILANKEKFDSLFNRMNRDEYSKAKAYFDSSKSNKYFDIEDENMVDSIRLIGIQLFFENAEYPFHLKFVDIENASKKYNDYTNFSQDDPTQGCGDYNLHKGIYEGVCAYCGCEVWIKDNAIYDDDGNLFCSENCLVNYHDCEEGEEY